MFEWHGWAVIAASPSAADDDAADTRAIQVLADVQAFLDAQSQVHNEVLDWRFVNGDMHVWIAGGHNHPTSTPHSLFQTLGDLAQGSYGVLYSIDHDLDAGWTRWVLRRGPVHVEPDQSLSPHIGLVEDPDAPG
jgi:hypothetical protein